MEFPKVLAPVTRLRVAFRALRKQACWRSTRRLAKSGLWASVALCVCASAESHRPVLITSLKVDVLQEKIEVHISADRALSIRAKVLTHPDRIVLDAAGALFKVKKPEIQINTSPVKSVRIRLLRSEPPVTRIVVETVATPTYTFRTERNSAFLDIALPAPQTPAIIVEKPPVPPNVTYDQGLLTIVAEDSTLAEILNAVHSRTGGLTEFPAAAANERATVKLGPAPVASVLAALLLGSPFDYVIVGSGREPNGIQIVLSEKTVRPESQGPAEGPASAQDLALANDAALPNFSGENPTPNSSEGRQPSAGTQYYMMNQPSVVVPVSERIASPENEERSLDPEPQEVRPAEVRPSKENPRVPPPDKHP